MATLKVARIFTNQSIVLEIFGCARHSSNIFGSALACAKICFEIFGCTRQYEQALLRSLARKFVRLVRPIRSPFYSLKGISVNFLIFSAALGIARTSSALHSLARKFVKFVGKKTGKFVLKSAISRQAKANKFSLVFWLNEIVGFRRSFWKNVANYALFSCFI